MNPLRCTDCPHYDHVEETDRQSVFLCCHSTLTGPKKITLAFSCPLLVTAGVDVQDNQVLIQINKAGALE